MQEDVILSFAEMMEVKSGETGQHVKRVSEYSRILGLNLGLSHEQAEVLRIASMMHDVGKILTPTEILEKPGKLTEEEFAVIKRHVTDGERMLHNASGKSCRRLGRLHWNIMSAGMEKATWAIQVRRSTCWPALLQWRMSMMH